VACEVLSVPLSTQHSCYLQTQATYCGTEIIHLAPWALWTNDVIRLSIYHSSDTAIKNSVSGIDLSPGDLDHWTRQVSFLVTSQPLLYLIWVWRHSLILDLLICQTSFRCCQNFPCHESTGRLDKLPPLPWSLPCPTDQHLSQPGKICSYIFYLIRNIKNILHVIRIKIAMRYSAFYLCIKSSKSDVYLAHTMQCKLEWWWFKCPPPLGLAPAVLNIAWSPGSEHLTSGPGGS
jgi:hypothetical protein